MDTREQDFRQLLEEVRHKFPATLAHYQVSSTYKPQVILVPKLMRCDPKTYSKM